MSTKTATKRTTRREPTRTLTIDATRAVAPDRVRSLAKALRIGKGEPIRVEVLGRTSGPRFDRAHALAVRVIGHLGGVVASTPGTTAA